MKSKGVKKSTAKNKAPSKQTKKKADKPKGGKSIGGKWVTVSIATTAFLAVVAVVLIKMSEVGVVSSSFYYASKFIYCCVGAWGAGTLFMAFGMDSKAQQKKELADDVDEYAMDYDDGEDEDADDEDEEEEPRNRKGKKPSKQPNRNAKKPPQKAPKKPIRKKPAPVEEDEDDYEEEEEEVRRPAPKKVTRNKPVREKPKMVEDSYMEIPETKSSLFDDDEDLYGGTAVETHKELHGTQVEVDHGVAKEEEKEEEELVLDVAEEEEVLDLTLDTPEESELVETVEEVEEMEEPAIEEEPSIEEAAPEEVAVEEASEIIKVVPPPIIEEKEPEIEEPVPEHTETVEEEPVEDSPNQTKETETSYIKNVADEFLMALSINKPIIKYTVVEEGQAGLIIEEGMTLLKCTSVMLNGKVYTASGGCRNFHVRRGDKVICSYGFKFTEINRVVEIEPLTRIKEVSQKCIIPTPEDIAKNKSLICVIIVARNDRDISFDDLSVSMYIHP